MAKKKLSAHQQSYQNHLKTQQLKSKQRKFDSLIKTNPEKALVFLAKSAEYNILAKHLKSSGTKLEDFLNLKDKNGNTIVHLAIEQQNKALLSYLIRNKVDFNISNNIGKTPLHVAAERGEAEVFGQLIKAGANQAAVDKDGLTPIQRVMGLKDEYADKFLALKDIDLKVNNKRGETALHRAVEIQDFKAAEKLVSKGVDINAQDKNGLTPLHLLVIKEYPAKELNEQIDKMIKAGADLTIQDNDGDTAFTDALVHGKIEVVKKLIDVAKQRNALGDRAKQAIITAAKKLRHDYDLPIIAQALGVDLEQIKKKDQLTPTLSSETEPTRDQPVVVPAVQSSAPTTIIEPEKPSFVTKKEEFIKKLKKEYGTAFNQTVLAKAISSINSSDSSIAHPQSKGKSNKFAELISGFRQTDNEMIQEISKQFKDFITKDNHQVSLPKRYAKKQTTLSQ